MAKYASNLLLLVALLCAFAAARINCLDQNGICKSLVETQGYTCEDHQVTTEDGYILGLQRIPSGKSSNNSTAQKLPVLLQHGLMGDAGSWLLNPPDQALAFILADKGFDVWLANARGTQASRGHKSLNNIDPAYWEWTWDQLAAYDLPAFFNYVNNQTGQKVHYVGHSLGTLSVLAALSQQKLSTTLRSAALLCPVAYLGQMSTLLGRISAQSYTAEGLYATGVREYPPPGEAAAQNLETFLCSQPGVDCSNFMAAVTGPNCCITPTSSILLFQHIPQSTSTKNMVHMSQMIRRGTITMFDYVLPAINMQRYNQLTPPVYNMASIPEDVPLFFGYGGRDELSDVNDVKALLNDLRDHDKDKLVEQYIEEYAHMDFIMAGNANQKVYDPLLTFFGQN
ncbi:PREDICTED: triacylglycerol lipase 2-like [Fragaria vesca subsp. vesca]|uniref:triacylglycerol lipase 2-like n=1 Tax=Fragaria vesca subsp. vesca TaxID=101020 RepID=UPI0002C3135D|nr:PREDICTED: triacylglycerol lipase 2-like [Fragaria vesca subsp. vesca]